MQKFSKQILSTRPLSPDLIRECAVHNIIVNQLPFIKTELIQDKQTINKIENYLAQDITAIFTSMNAVDGVIKYLKQPVNWKIYCIGNTTRGLVADNFGNETIAGTASGSDELADVIIKDKITHAIFFCGDQRRDELPRKLQQHNVLIEELIVYKTIETPVLIDGNYAAILFFSPSAVDSFFSKNTVGSETQMFAIGSTTAKAIQQYNENNVVIAGLPGKENLVRQVIEYYKGEM